MTGQHSEARGTATAVWSTGLRRIVQLEHVVPVPSRPHWHTYTHIHWHTRTLKHMLIYWYKQNGIYIPTKTTSHSRLVYVTYIYNTIYEHMCAYNILIITRIYLVVFTYYIILLYTSINERNRNIMSIVIFSYCIMYTASRNVVLFCDDVFCHRETALDRVSFEFTPANIILYIWALWGSPCTCTPCFSKKKIEWYWKYFISHARCTPLTKFLTAPMNIQVIIATVTPPFTCTYFVYINY